MISERDARIGRDLGEHAAAQALEKLADIVQTAENEPQRLVASAYATAAVMARLESSKVIMTQPDGENPFATTVEKVFAELLPSFMEQAKKHASERLAVRR